MIFVVLAAGCNQEEQLRKREAALLQREQELDARQQAIQVKEEEILRRQMQIDSSMMTDSLSLLNPAMLGTWAVKMTCTETSCTGSAVGDTKTEQWQVGYEGQNLVVKAIANEQLVRVYTGSYMNDALELTAQPADSTQQATRMFVRLQMTQPNRMEGRREITREDNCKIVYAVEMTKP